MEKLNKKVLLYASGIILFILAIVAIVFVNNNTKTTKLEIKQYATRGEVSSCTVLEVENSKAKEYSFDNGKTWQEDGQALFCNLEEEIVEVVAKDKEGKVIATSSVNVSNGDTDIVVTRDVMQHPQTAKFEKTKYTCKKGERLILSMTSNPITAEAKMTLKKGKLNATLLKPTNCEYCTVETYMVVVKCDKDLTEKLEITTDEGLKFSTTVIVGKGSSDVDNTGTIKFDRSSYNCNKGDKIAATITAASPNGLATVKSFKSLDTKIATIKKQTKYTLKCINCVAVEITCVGEGEVNLEAESSTGAKKKVAVRVSDYTINYDESEYVCEENQKMLTLLKAVGMSKEDRWISITKYGSEDTDIATVKKHPTLAVKCIGCIALEIHCKKVGKTNAYAEATGGVTTKSKITVTNKGTISFDKPIFNCKEGEKIDVTVRTTGTSTTPLAGIKSYTSSDTTIATVKKHPTNTLRCANCLLLQVTCKKEGVTSIKAESTLGAKTNSTISVKPKVAVTNVPNKIYFDKSSYSCSVGDTIPVKVTVEGKNGTVADTIGKLEVVDGKIVNIKTPFKKDSTTSTVSVECKKEGKTTIKATSAAKAYKGVPITVYKKATGSGISLGLSKYDCKVGDTISTIIEARGGATVASYKSSDTTIATIQQDPKLVVYCINCIAVQIKCLKTGTTKLSAEASDGSKIETSFVVNPKTKSTIAFNKSQYDCKVGETVGATIIVSGDTTDTVKSFASSDKATATIEKDTSITPASKNITPVKIKCLKEGKVELTAESKNGAVVRAIPVVIKAKAVGKVTFDNTKYSCVTGRTITTNVTATEGTVQSFKSSNAAVASIKEHPSITSKCFGCKTVLITCKKAGLVELSAGSSTGASTVVKAEVKDGVYFDKENYTCKKGASFTTYIRVSLEGPLTNIKSYTSSNTSVATLAKKENVNYEKAVAVTVTCKKVGTSVLTVTSKKGVTYASTLTVTE